MNKKKELLVSIIILNYNGGKLLEECIESIIEHTNCEYEIILIDNASTDNSHKECKKKFLEIQLVEKTENLGMSSRNDGIKIAKGQFITLLDSDTIVTDNWMQSLLESYTKHGPGLYQPKLLDKNNIKKINSAGNWINILGIGFSNGKGDNDSEKYNKFETISYTSGACTFSSTEIFRKIGDVDEIFFAYHDDLDYGWRAQLQGIPCYYEPTSIVCHYGSPTLQWSKKKFYLLERNRWICLLSCYSTKTVLKLFPALFVIEIGMMIYFIITGLGISKIKATFSIIKLHSDIKNRKEKIQKTRKIKDRNIIKKFSDDFFIPTNIAEGIAAKMFTTVIKNISKIARKII